MIKITGVDKVTAVLREKARQLRELSTPEGLAQKLTEKHVHLVCPDHGGRPTYAVKPEDGQVTGTYCCEKLRDMAKEAGFKPL